MGINKKNGKLGQSTITTHGKVTLNKEVLKEIGAQIGDVAIFRKRRNGYITIEAINTT